jgi:hypothetical protein
LAQALNSFMHMLARHILQSVGKSPQAKHIMDASVQNMSHMPPIPPVPHTQSLSMLKMSEEVAQMLFKSPSGGVMTSRQVWQAAPPPVPPPPPTPPLLDEPLVLVLVPVPLPLADVPVPPVPPAPPEPSVVLMVHAVSAKEPTAMTTAEKSLMFIMKTSRQAPEFDKDV